MDDIAYRVSQRQETEMQLKIELEQKVKNESLQLGDKLLDVEFRQYLLMLSVTVPNNIHLWADALKPFNAVQSKIGVNS